MGKATGKNRKKRPLGLGSNNKSLEKRELLKKGERKAGKVFARVGYLGVCRLQPIIKLAFFDESSLFHTQDQERKIFPCKVVVSCCVENEDDERGGRAARTAAVKVEQEYQR